MRAHYIEGDPPLDFMEAFVRMELLLTSVIRAVGDDWPDGLPKCIARAAYLLSPSFNLALVLAVISAG